MCDVAQSLRLLSQLNSRPGDAMQNHTEIRFNSITQHHRPANRVTLPSHTLAGYFWDFVYVLLDNQKVAIFKRGCAWILNDVVPLISKRLSA